MGIKGIHGQSLGSLGYTRGSVRPIRPIDQGKKERMQEHYGCDLCIVLNYR